MRGAASNFLRPEGFSGIELYRSTNSVRAVPRHVHFVHSISLAEAGRRAHVTARESFELKPGAITIIRAGEMHSAHSFGEEACSSLAIRFSEEFMASTLAGLTENKVKTLDLSAPVFHDAEIAVSLLVLYRKFEGEGTLLEREAALLDLFSGLLERQGACRMPEPGRENEAILRVRDYLTDSFEENVFLASLAEMVGLSPHYLCRAFARVVGVPPHAYQRQVRLKRAADMLAQGMLPGEAALASGFFDQSHFHKAFQRQYGVSPGRYLGRS